MHNTKCCTEECWPSLHCEKPVSFEPSRTLFVAQAWPKGADRHIYFTNIPSALRQAAKLNPTVENAIRIQIYPGAYSQDIDIVSNVHIVGANKHDVTISGNITWTPGIGANAPQTNDLEISSLENLILTGSITRDSHSKQKNRSIFNIHNCVATFLFPREIKDLTNIGREFPSQDVLRLTDCVHRTNLLSDGGRIIMLGALFSNGSITLNRNTELLFFGENINAGVQVAVNDASQCFINGTTVAGDINISVISSMDAKSSNFEGNLIVDGSADIRYSYYDPEKLKGSGEVLRTLFGITGVPATEPTTTVFFEPSYPDNNYQVQISQVGGDTFSNPFVTNKTNNSFTINNQVVPEAAYDISLLHN